MTLFPLLVGLLAPTSLQEPENGIFEREIAPILKNNCLECHGQMQQKGGLRLDIKAAAMAGSDYGEYPVIIPKKALESPLFFLVNSIDLEDRMPPEEKDPLSAKEIQLLKDWINQGAVWPEDGKEATWPTKHWAYQLPQWPKIPLVEDKSWCRNTIDRFIISRLSKAEINPSPQADFSALARRSSLDLTGLPPDPTEMNLFLGSPSEQAWNKWLDKLFSSKSYGENQALGWLDLARYADSNGFEKDDGRSMSPWRDWVIEAFNINMPFDQFTAEQLAGDLMSSPSLSQTIATGFHRNTMTNAEGGVDDEEYRVAAVVDRVNTTATVWLGTTMACVQCHDHKYDPLTSSDYYSMYAIFNDGQDGGTTHGPSVDVLTNSQVSEVSIIDKKLAQLKETLVSAQTEGWVYGKELLWIDETKPPGGVVEGDWEFHEPEVGVPVHDGTSVRKQVGEEFVQHFFHAATDGPINRGDDRAFAWIYLDPKSPPITIVLQFHAGDWEHRAFWGEDTFTYGISGTPSRLHQGNLPPTGKWVRLEVSLSSVGIAPNTRLDGMAFGQLGGTAYWDEAGTLNGNPKVASIRAEMSALDIRRPIPTSTLIMAQVKEPRDVHILEQGNFLSPGRKVEPGVPRVMNKQTKVRPKNRLEFSEWLANPKNPLTSRVIMNRLWEQVFGSGLVATSSDFGTRGETPSHPELLDWLALEFQRLNWDMKAMHRLMVNSATYRQSSKIRGDVVQLDPENRLLAWFPRMRLKAEQIRDQALQASGLLVSKIGGSSVFPPQPIGIDNSTYAGDRWINSSGEDKYRRGIYTFWRRTSPYPTFQIFDAPSREVACTRRDQSNTPLQALALLNDPVFVEAAKALGKRMAEHKANNDNDRICFGFRLCTARYPNDLELTTLAMLLANDGWEAVGTVLLNLDEMVTRE